jgi:hypothetical protein
LWGVSFDIHQRIGLADINNRLAESQMSSNQLIKIETNITAPPISNTFLRPILLLMDNRLQMDLESRFVIKPAPRTDKEVLIKSAVIRRIMIPIKTENSS